ncbi:hypothetical protein HDU91_004053, partial [Kappamyces sp. JEL0680]
SISPKRHDWLHKYIRLDPSLVTSSQLLYLAKMGHAECCSILKETDFTPQDPSIYQALFRQSLSQTLGLQTKICWTLLSGGYPVDPEVDNGSVLWNAARAGNPDVVEYLLNDSRFNGNAEDCLGLRLAASHGRPSCLKAFLAYPNARPNACNNEALRMASMRGHVKCVKLLLLQKSVDPSANQHEALVKASMKGHLLVAILILHDKRVDPVAAIAAQGHAALYLAHNHGHVEVVNYLFAVAMKAPRLGNDFCIRFACRAGLLEQVETCLRLGAHPAVKDNYCIRSACQFGHLGIVRRLLQDPRVDPSACRNDALAKATKHRHAAIVAALETDVRVRQM